MAVVPVSKHVLPPDRVYACRYSARETIVPYLLAIPVFCAERLLRLESKSWWQQGLCMLVIGLLGGTLNGWIFCTIMRLPYLKRGMACFGLLYGGTLAGCYFLAAWRWQSAFCALSVIFSLILCLPFAKHRSMGTFVVVWAVVCQAFLFGLVSDLENIKQYFPGLLKAIVAPVIVMAYEFLGYLSFLLGWRRFYQKGIYLEFFPIVAAILVQTAEAIRLVGVIASIQSQNDVECIKEAALNIVFGIVAEVAARSMFVHSLVAHMFCSPLSISPEQDALLRARFLYGYTPFLTLVPGVPAALLYDARWPQTWKVPALILSAFIGQMLTDLCFVLAQRYGTGESIRETYRRLQTAGGHRILNPLLIRFDSIHPMKGASGAPHVQGRSKSDPSDEDGDHIPNLSIGCTRLHSFYMRISFLIYWGWPMTESGMVGLFGPCLWSLPQGLCTE